MSVGKKIKILFVGFLFFGSFNWDGCSNRLAGNGKSIGEVRA
ncbi:hypothetical protein NG800_018650 [Epilithonimonas ginsengisoli]|uniref:Variable outer membrane protein n=1 Tax=Epilithonimonas ginsengisoli TaxID=1245592 RepID=A0ABU4JML2_9FLAO|nr:MULTISPECIES: hypothetical protein [Chryseobacterium group]MDW8550954.1 hypothetical protein [Epilithonimonas ginsengisoli]